MRIFIDTSKAESLDFKSEELQAKGEDALDALWKEQWLLESISKKDLATLEKVKPLAKKIKEKSDMAVVITSGNISMPIKSALTAFSPEESGIPLEVFGETLSGKDYAELIEKLEGKDFSLIGIGAEEEPLSQKAAFTCIKQLLIEKYGAEEAADRIILINNEKDKFLAEQVGKDDVVSLIYPKETPLLFSANTVAMLLPLEILGVDTEEFLEGFCNLLSSPNWDLDAKDYGIIRAKYFLSGGKNEELVVWQRELEGIENWMKCLYGDNAVTNNVPQHKETDRFQTYILAEKEDIDIALPSFEGCSEDGSLNVLLKDQFYGQFYDEKKSNCRVKIEIEVLNPYTFGQMFAFVQTSWAISNFILNN